MKLSASNPCAEPGRARRRGGFTLAEVLVAMLFIGLVIPAALRGTRLASDIGTLASRRTTAVALGEGLLNQLVVTDEWRSGSTSGQFEGPHQDIQWRIESLAWQQPGMTELTLYVDFPVRESRHQVILTTLVPETQPTPSTGMTGL